MSQADKGRHYGAPPFSMLDVIGLLGLPYPPSGRASYNINCPCCDDRNKKHLHINLVRGVFRCPRCGFSGGVIDLYAHYTNLDHKAALKALRERIGFANSPAGQRQAGRPPPLEAEECPLAGIEERDATYRAFLDRLSLASDHRDNLRVRGLTDEVIGCNLYRTTPAGGYESIAKQLLKEGHYLAGVPGFYRRESGAWAYIGTKRGILLPVRDVLGRIQGIKVRLDKVSQRKFRWISSREMPDGCGPEAWTHTAGRPRETILLTEGPLKADIVHFLTGNTVVAVSGVSSLTHLCETLAHMKAQGTQKVMTAFDMDMLSNAHVQQDFYRLAAMLEEMGFQFGTYLWDPRYKGLDDYVWAQAKGKAR